MKVLVTGVGGQLGYDVAVELHRRGHTVYGTDVHEPYAPSAGVAHYLNLCNGDGLYYSPLDITDEAHATREVKRLCPDAMIHCAAWTAVDDAEAPSNYKTVYAVNAAGTRNLARAAKTIDAKMVYISTDYVFDGAGEEPWEPDCEDYSPINVYGETKLEGEFAVAEELEKFFIVRIAWVFGKNGNNFIKTMLRVGKNHDVLRVVNDQIGTPTYTYDLARLLVDMVETEKYGYYHATNEGGYISWYDFACEIFRKAVEEQEREGVEPSEMFYKDISVIPVTTEEYGLSAAARPFNSRLDKSKLDAVGFERLPTWQDALGRYLSELDTKV